MATHIQYPYAYDEENNLVHINSIEREHKNERTYHCPCCDHLMIPRIGEFNVPHFAHADNQKCGIESYIHIIAKRILVTRFNDRSRPFNVKFWTRHICKNKDSCKYYEQHYCEDSVMDEFDLHKSYDRPAREEIRMKNASDSVFQPDVILQSSSFKHNPIYLEVYHKHRISPKKRNSGQYIIEIRVKDWSELLDLDSVEIKQSDRIAFYNFKDRLLTPESFLERAEQLVKEYNFTNPDSVLPGCYRSREGQREFQDLWRIVLYPSGKTFISGIYEEEKLKHHPSAIADFTYRRKRVPESFNLIPLLVARLPKERRNCFMCCHQVQNDSDNHWCELVKNGSTRKGTFDKDKGSKCSFFEWYRNSEDLQQSDLVEGVDYIIWINPKPLI